MLKPFIVIVIVLLLVLSVSDALLSQFSSLQLIGSKGNVEFLGVEAYWDQGLTNRTEKIDWGTVPAGSSQNVTLYLRNTSDFNATFELSTANWTLRNSTNGIVAGPSQSSPFMNLTWNYNNATVCPGGAIQVTLILKISSSPEFTSMAITKNVKGFDFDIMIAVNG